MYIFAIVCTLSVALLAAVGGLAVYLVIQLRGERPPIVVRRRRTPRAGGLPNDQTGPVLDYILKEAVKARCELRFPDPNSSVDRDVILAKAGVVLRELENKEFGKDVRAADLRHLVRVYYRAVMFTTEEEVEMMEDTMSYSNTYNHALLKADREDRSTWRSIMALFGFGTPAASLK